MERQNRIIREGIISFNEPFLGGSQEQFTVCVNDKNSLIGGAVVYAHTQSIYINILWVDSNYRGLSIGSTLLEAVENEAVKRNITSSTLDTFSFQAEKFYLKSGYKRLGIIEDYIEGHDRIFLRKAL
tara:strand:+ start:182 stop:562 length:381 start_codon:yes stop_codon:yes gene_type:complete